MNNPPAFPNINLYTKEGIEVYGDSGLTMRDYFAAKAMQAFISTLPEIKSNQTPKWSVIASDAYRMADAMMKAREQ